MAKETTADLIVMPRCRSRARESVWVLPSSTLPISSITPAAKSSRSVRLVLPASTCARMPRFRYDIFTLTFSVASCQLSVVRADNVQRKRCSIILNSSFFILNFTCFVGPQPPHLIGRRQQFVQRPLCLHAPVLENNDSIRPRERGAAMGHR